MKEVLVVLLCYLIGSIPFSYLFGRIFGKVDVRSRGSGNVGATNVLRTTGVKVALLALAGDLFKGYFAAWLGFQMGGPVMLVLCPFAAVCGHCCSVFLKFRGGKGVATAAGTILFLAPEIFLILLILLVLIVVFSGYVSLASIIAASIFPILVIAFDKSLAHIVVSILIALTVIYKHRANIVRLRNGTEAKINEKA